MTLPPERRPPQRQFQVVHAPFVFVRAEADLNSAKLGKKEFGERFWGVSDGTKWVKLCDEKGYMLVDGRSAGLLGSLIEDALGSPSVMREAFVSWLFSSEPRLERSTSGADQCERWTALSCMVSRERPSASAKPVAIALAGDLAWSLNQVENGFKRFIEPDGWVSLSGSKLRFEQLDTVASADLWAQARVAVAQAIGGYRSRLELRRFFDSWEREPIPTLAALHRDVVLWAQQRAVVVSPDSLGPPGSITLPRWARDELRDQHFVALPHVLSPERVAACMHEAEALDDGGKLTPTPLHRALGDRTDRIIGLDPSTAPPHLATLCADLKALALDFGLLVLKSSMLACYSPGDFYGPHKDSAAYDPRRITAIIYLLPPDWSLDDGGHLVWWLPTKNGTSSRQVYQPSPGALVLFNATTVLHEVTPPTKRRRFAVNWLAVSCDYSFKKTCTSLRRLRNGSTRQQLHQQAPEDFNPSGIISTTRRRCSPQVFRLC